MVNFTKEEWETLRDICQKWQVECSVINDNSELFSVLARIKHKMLKEIPTMSLDQLQNHVSETEFVGKRMEEANNALLEEEKLAKELREKCVKNLE